MTKECETHDKNALHFTPKWETKISLFTQKCGVLRFLSDLMLCGICGGAGLQLEWQYGVLAARSKCSIGCLVRPVRRLFYKWTVHYQLLKPEDSEALSLSILVTGWTWDVVQL